MAAVNPAAAAALDVTWNCHNDSRNDCACPEPVQQIRVFNVDQFGPINKPKLGPLTHRNLDKLVGLNYSNQLNLTYTNHNPQFQPISKPKFGPITSLLQLFQSYTIGLGLHGLFEWDEPGSQIIKANFSMQHPQYIRPWNSSDLMLIKLNRPVVESDTIRTTPIASKCPTPGTRCWISSWGRLLDGYYPLDLQCVLVPVVPEEYCSGGADMGTTEEALWLCFLGCIIHTATGPLGVFMAPGWKQLMKKWGSDWIQSPALLFLIWAKSQIRPLCLSFTTSNEAEILPKGTRNHFPDVPLMIRKRIADGFPCNPHSQPWMAALFENYEHYCSGVLVHPQWVLSAAHCWKTSYTIVLGLHGLYDWFEPGSQIVQSFFSVQHPDYVKPSSGNDLMLIKLNTPVVESDTIKTIPIASRCPTSGTRCRTSGWGQLLNGYDYPYYLQCAIIPVVSEEDCRFELKPSYHDSMFCAGAEGRMDTCRADSGGPVVCGGFLQGLVSWGFQPCGQPGIPSAYTNLCKFKDWINEIIQTR
ncbi:PREDICTED: uncharacterized protein LOC102014618 [Chinchilla lanigera]|uniref:uncharacterized protein LOC102014618 n=1 Tax=Chinchilla lanigera TaxID=34839 RepID=UPI0006980AB8|nr:PREDICTED: uncharacterized protein LOC102014618 [Chinchilla lanigera]